MHTVEIDRLFAVGAVRRFVLKGFDDDAFQGVPLGFELAYHLRQFDESFEGFGSV